MMAAAAGSPAREELNVPPAAQPRRGAPAGPTPTLLHDTALHSATNIAAASTAPITPVSLAASLHSCISSPTGTKLAVTTPSDSPAGGEGARITLDEEKQIALSQLQELEVAIKVRKVTKVDGRKIRWIEYRARKQAEEEKQSASSKKRPRRSRSKTKGVENNENEANVNNNNSSSNSNNNNNNINNNNNNNNNNSNKTESTMKVESANPPISAVGTSNVLESMKQQFLQGTENVEEPVINGKSSILAESSLAGQKRKSGRTRKSTGTSEGGSPFSTSPKKLSPSDTSPKGANLRSGGASQSNSSTNSSLSEASLALSSTPTTPLTSDQPLAIGIKKNFFTSRSLTKGLREIRKMENGSDGVPTIKTEENKTPVSSPSASLHLTTLASAVSDVVVAETKAPPDHKSPSVETKSSKTTCPLIKAAAKLMSQPAARSKSTDSSSTKGKKGGTQKGSAKKVSTKSGVRPVSEPRTIINGHTPMVQNGSEEVPILPALAGASGLGEPGSDRTSKPGSRESSPRMPYDSDSSLRRPRGRPPKRLILKKEGTTVVSTGKSGKKLATLVVDVHNTMNGEPQTVIPVSRPVLRGKRTSSSKSPKKVMGKTALDLAGSSDIKSSPAPSPKRQKNSETKTSQSSSTSTDTKKGKTNKKNNEKPVVIKEEKDNTSASSTNQTQGPPDHTHSTKLTKGVQRTANKEIAPEIYTAISYNPPSHKKKKVKKPVLKVKTLPVKHKEINKIVKKSKKVTSIGANKQNKAQPKKNSSIRKYLSSHKGKAVPKVNSNKKDCSQSGLKINGGEDEGQGEEGVSLKQEQDTSSSKLEGVQPGEEDASLQNDSSILKTDTIEMEVGQDLLTLKSTESEENEDLNKANQASEESCVASLTGPAGDFGEDSSTEVKPCITNVVPHNQTETQTLVNESSTAVNILGIDQSYEKVCDLPKISFQNNNNINNNNPEEDGVVISEKEIIIVKDLSTEKLSPSNDEMKCITKADSDTKASENIETFIDMQENVKNEEPQSLMPATASENLQEEESSHEQKSFENEMPSEIDVKTEEDVNDKSKSYVEVMPDIVTLDSSQSNGTYEGDMLSSSSLIEMPKEKEMPVLEAVSCPASTPSPSLLASAASVTALPKVIDKSQEEQVLGCDRLSQSLSDPEEQKTATSGTLTDEGNHTSENVDAKETYPIEESEVTQTSEVNQVLEFVEPSDCKEQVAGVQANTLKDEGDSGSVIPVSQKSSPKQVKKREGSVVRKKVKKGFMQGHNITQLERRGQEVQEEIEITKMTKAQETSQASAEKALESSEVLNTLTSSQKENVEVQDLIPEAQPAPLALAPEAHSSSVTKTKDKVPRILKQLFQDEGVQNMLKSMSEDPGSVPETSPSSDSGMHKLRPKRVTEPMLSSSPELDAMEALFTSSRKKKRGSELDTLYIDEGVLNLLTSKEHNSRRGHQEDAASDISQASSSKSFKVSKSMKPVDVSSETRKRKLSGASTASNASSSSKSLQPPEPKKVRLDVQEPTEDPYEVDAAEEFKEKPVIMGYSNLEAASSITKKKALPVVPLSVKQKNKAIKMQLKLQKQKQLKSTVSEGSEGREDSKRMVEMSGTLKGPVDVFPVANSLPVSIESSKSVPPIKIKLASDSVTIKPVPRPCLPQQPAEVTIVAKPPVRLPIKPQVVDSASPPVHRTLSLPQVRTSPEKPKPHPDYQSPPSHLRRVESFAGPVPAAPSFSSLVRNCDPAAAAAAAVAAAAAAAASKSRQRVGGESVRQSQRASVRQSEANYHFRDIALRKFNNFTQIILSPSTTKMKNALNSRVLRELCEALNTLKRDDSVRIVLLTGTGSTFCQGVDLTALQHPNLETRKKNAENLVRGIKDFLKALVQFPKPIIAGVNGNAMGLGVTMLPLFDMVIANDKAEFCLPYAKLGQVPEGGATYTFPNLCGKLQSTQLFLGHKLTARRAQEMGLVSESIWPATYQQELIPKVALLATHSAQSMEATKALMNHHLVTKLELSLESECRLLLQQWTSPHFAHLCKRFLDTQYIHLQKPVSLPL